MKVVYFVFEIWIATAAESTLIRSPGRSSAFFSSKRYFSFYNPPPDSVPHMLPFSVRSPIPEFPAVLLVEHKCWSVAGNDAPGRLLVS